MFKKQKKLTFVAITAILFGIGFVVHGVILIIEADIAAVNTLEKNLSKETSLNIVGVGTEQDSTKYIQAKFETSEIFAGDTIELTISAPYASLNLQKITIIVSDPSFYFDDDVNLLYKAIVRQPPNDIIQLLPNTDPPFQTTKKVKFVEPNQEIVIYAVSFGENTIAKYKGYVDLKVHAETDRLKVKTDNAILEQINEQEKTNKIFLGLAWIGVAVIPTLAGTDILLRIHFKD